MSDPALLDIPTSACASHVVMTLTRIVGSSQSPFTGEEQFFKWAGEFWAMEYTFPPFTSRAVFEEWMAFALKLEGRYGRFLAGDPSARRPRGAATGTPKVDGGAQTGNTLNIKGCAPSVASWLLRGDYFQVGSGASARLHKLTADAPSDGFGKATLAFVPALRYSPSDNSDLVVTGARGLFRLTDNAVTWSADPGPVYTFNFKAVEAL